MLLVRKNYQPTVHNLINDFFKENWFEGINNQRNVEQPKANIIENDKEYKIEMLVPGFKKEDLQLSIEDNSLTIAVEKEEINEQNNENQIYSEFRVCNFRRSFGLSKNVDIDNITADFNDGILNVMIPKKEEVNLKKLIEVK